MNRKNEPSTADIADRHRRLMALAMLVVAGMYLVFATAHIVNLGGAYLETVVVGMAMLTLALLIPVIYWKIRKLPSGERHVYFSSDGYVAETLNRARKASWVTTFLLLVALETFSDKKYLADLSGEFYLQFVIAVMLGVMSLVFLFLNRANEEHEVEEGIDA